MLTRNNDHDLEIAELLVFGDFLKPHDLDRALAAKRQKGTPLATILLENRLTSDSVLRAAEEVVREIHNGRILQSQARNALHLLGNSGLTMEDVIARLGQQKAANPWSSNLDRLAAKFSS